MRARETAFVTPTGYYKYICISIYISTYGLDNAPYVFQGCMNEVLPLIYIDDIPPPPKLHPCAFFSNKLSPVEKNYDIGNRKLLAIKLALKVWHHWLEISWHPFLVITDQRHLEYP